MRIDLHTHSTASDGIYSPSELIDHARSSGVEVIAITDHDTVAGIPEAVEHARAVSFNLVPGIEFSIEYAGGSFHLIGLYVDYTNEELVETTNRLSVIRNRRLHLIIDDLKRHGIEISALEVEAESGEGASGRPHVARVLMRHGYGTSMQEIFQNFLVKGKPGYVKKERIELDEAVRLINISGGLPLIAHPVTLNIPTRKDFEDHIKEYIDRGVKGLEVYSSLHTHDDITFYRFICEKYGLFVSGGSDFHGDKNERIGYYSENTPIPEKIFQDLSMSIARPESRV